jgi:hypothetical protein
MRPTFATLAGLLRGIGLALLLLGPLLPAGRAAGAPAPWWRRSFPPAAIAIPEPRTPARIDPAQAVPELGCGSLDLATLDGNGVFLFGWACDFRTGTPAPAVLVLDNGRPVSPPVHVFRERPDVAETMKNRRLSTSGWILWLPLARVSPGPHTFEAFALLSDGKLGRLPGIRRIERPGT